MILPLSIREPLPSPLMMDTPGSFAYYTWHHRWPSIVQQVRTSLPYPAEVQHALDHLLSEMHQGVMQAQPDRYGPDLALWERDLAPYRDRPWAEVPWFFAEVYFYRRLLAATQYFHPGEWFKQDPFAAIKAAGLAEAQTALSPLVLAFSPLAAHPPQEAFAASLDLLLWGNRADLSLNPGANLSLGEASADLQAQILVDDRMRAIAHLQPRLPLNRVDVIADNAGFELVSDLAWIDLALTTGLAQEVYLHLKAYPTFVSDATFGDLKNALLTLLHHKDAAVQALGNRLQAAIVTRRLRLREALFWTAPRVFWAMPEPLQEHLAASDLLIFKGDANYRRILGDRQWEATTPFATIARYLPAPTLSLRTLKSEIVVGLSPGQADQMQTQDPDWRVNGHWGVIQYCEAQAAS